MIAAAEKTDSKATPRPWKVEQCDDFRWMIHDGGGVIAVSDCNTRGDAVNEARYRRIVRAVNHHDELVAALREMVETQDEWEKSVSKIIGRPVTVFERAVDRARSVLSKVST